MKIHFLLLALLCSLLATVDTAQAAGLSTSSLDGLSRRLELSPEQRQEVAERLYQADAALVDIQAQIRKAELQLTYLLDAPDPNQKAVMKAVDELGKARAGVLRNRTALLLDLKDVMEEEQWLRLKSIHRHHIGQSSEETVHRQRSTTRRGERPHSQAGGEGEGSRPHPEPSPPGPPTEGPTPAP